MPSVVLDLLHPGLEDADRPLLLVDLVVALAVLTPAQPGDDPGELRVPAGALLGGAADDERRPRLVDQDRVDLVHDREVVAALHALLQAPGHVVAQVVEAELVVGAVGDVGAVLLAALLRRLLGQDHAHLEPEEAVHPAHPLRVALGQVVVDRDDVHALPAQRVEVGRQRRDQGLALAGLHLGDVAQVQRGPAHQLHVEVPLAQRAAWPPRGPWRTPRAAGRRAVSPSSSRCLNSSVMRAQLGVAQRGEVLFDRVDLFRDPLELAQGLALTRAQDTVDDGWHFLSRSSRIVAGYPEPCSRKLCGRKPWAAAGETACRADDSQWRTGATRHMSW